MKARTFVSICLIAGAAAWAQSTPPSQKVVPETKPVAAKPAAKPTAAAAKPAQPAAKPAAQATAPAVKPAVAKPAVAKPAAVKPAVAKTAAEKPAAAVKKAMVKTPTAKKAEIRSLAVGKRDPFVSPLRVSDGGPAGPTCTTGKKCLAVDAVDLKGIVQYHAGMIAVVESSTRRVTYFLRENDPVFNGYVMKITPDSVVFRENVVDRMGKQSTRDVTKKVVAPAV